MIVVSDTSPICYLLLMGQIGILKELYGAVVIPQVVADELSAFESSALVQDWIAEPPDWLQVYTVEVSPAVTLDKLDPGEQAAIALAEELAADLIILDDKAARQIARDRGLKLIGLLGILKAAASRGLLDLELAFEQLQSYGFWVAPALLARLLRDD
ncbi:MAG: DUF3368 domain-containing protein [Cyanobacteria bacterium P01_G01_bin.54]